MIPSSWIAKSLAGTSAFAILAAMLVAAATDAPVEIEGGSTGSALQAHLGSSFADLAQGTQTPDPVAPPEAANPEAAEPLRPDAPTPADVPAAEPTVPDRIEPDLTEARADSPKVASDLPTTAIRPDTVAPAPPTHVAPETVVGEAPEPGVVLSSQRPPARTREFEQANRRPDPPKSAAPAPQADQKTSRSSASSPTNAGSNGGSRSSNATQNRARAQASQAGNAAASNYPGQVMARLNRVRRPSIRATGQARVSFSISSSGGLSSIGIAGSSGSSELDRAAVRLVQSAAPFPPPPPGAQRRFAINISGR